MTRLALMTRLVFLCWLGLGVAGTSTAESFDEQQDELAKLRNYVSEVSTRMQQLQKLLRVSEERNRMQSQLIDSLEKRLEAQSVFDPRRLQGIREAFFRQVADDLPLSPIYRVDRDRLVVYVDPIYIFRTAEIGAEGQARVAELPVALQSATRSLPDGLRWRLHVQGHSDVRLPSSDASFQDNWDLSAARAVAFLRVLLRGGFEGQQVYASGLAATRLAALGNEKSDHRKNRRIEIHLELHQAR